MPVGAAFVRATLLPSMIRSGFSATKALASFKTMGYGQRKTDFLQAYRSAAGMIRFEVPIKNLKMNTLVPKNFMAETELRRARNFRVVGNATIFNEADGSFRERTVSMYSETQQTKAGYTDEYIEAQGKEKYRPEETIMSIEWYVVQHNIGAPYS